MRIPPLPHSPLKRLLVAGVVIGVIVVIGYALFSGGDERPDVIAGEEFEQRTSLPADDYHATTTGGETIVVPAPKATTSKATPSAPRTSPKAPKKVRGQDPATKGGPAAVPLDPILVPDTDSVDWPDALAVGRVAVRVGNLIAASDGRDGMRAFVPVRGLMAPSVWTAIRGFQAQNAPTAGTPKIRGRITAIRLSSNPDTGAREVKMTFERREGRQRILGVLNMEFAPSKAIVTSYQATPYATQPTRGS